MVGVEDGIKRNNEDIWETYDKLRNRIQVLEKGICLILTELLKREVEVKYNEESKENEIGYSKYSEDEGQEIFIPL